MFCGHCGNQQTGGRFCGSCGLPFSETVGVASTGNGSANQPSPPMWRSGVAHHPSSREVAGLAGLTVHGIGSECSENGDVMVNVAGPRIVYRDGTGSDLATRVLWFLCFGWLLGFLWILVAWVFNATIIGLPVGLMMFNAVPRVMTLKPRSTGLSLTADANGSYTLTRQYVAQHPFRVRAVYFVFVGSWFSLVWAMTAYAFALLIITLPLSFMMFDRMPAVTTLARY